MRISAALLVLAAVAPLHAQSAPAPRPTALPVSLVSALFSSSQPVGRGTVYTVGEPPAGWPMELWPPGGAVVGGMTEGRMLVAVFADTNQRPLASYLTLLRNGGFTQPTPHGNGFISSPSPFSWYCRDSVTVTARTAPSPLGVSYLRVSYVQGTRSGCSPQAASPPRTMEMLELPELPPPKGLRVRGSGGGSSPNSVSSNATFVGISVTPAAMAEHYARLLTAAGWTAAAASSDSTSAAQLFRARDRSGRAWQGALWVFATASGRNVNLVMQPEDQR